MAAAVPFPTTQPPGFTWLDDEPEFDASRHLALTEPDEIITLADLGYDDAEIETKATPVAVSSPFRVLSDEGAEIMLATARRLREFARPAGDRVERVVRGGCYRSAWFRDLCLAPEVTEAMHAIYGVDVAPHAMPLHLGHLNFEPEHVATPVDKWHHDTLPLDYVMIVNDPATFAGGRFEWFHGTKHEAADLASRGETPQRDRVVVPDFPGPGYAIALHGNMVIHRGAPLDAPGERITMVNGYVATNVHTDEQSRTRDLLLVDDHDVLLAEWARHVAWRSAGRLQAVVDTVPFGTDLEAVKALLEDAVHDVNQAIADMHDPDVTTVAHYEGGSIDRR